MSMKKGEWHRNANGKLVRKRGPYKHHKVVPTDGAIEEATTNEASTPQTSPLRELELALDSFWKHMTVDGKLHAVREYFRGD